MIYSPVVIPTLNRVDHLKNCLDSLKNNTHSENTDIYISVDYPPSEQYLAGYEKVLDYLNKGISGFNKCFVFVQKENLGPLKNGEFIIEKVTSYYDSFIFTEDDNIFAPNFLDYILKGIELLSDDKDFLGICGHSYTLEWPFNKRNTEKIQTLFDGWGIGYRSRDYEEASRYIKESLYGDFLDLKKMEAIRRRQPFLFGQIYSYLRDKKSSEMSYGEMLYPMDQTLAIYMMIMNKYLIMPHVSLVRNMGDDGSGVHGGDNIKLLDLSNQPIQSSDFFEFKGDLLYQYNAEIDDLLRQYIYLCSGTSNTQFRGIYEKYLFVRAIELAKGKFHTCDKQK